MASFALSPTLELTYVYIMKRTTALLAALALVTAPSAALAHVTVSPNVSNPGAWEKYDLRMPNEKKVATIRLEVKFPAGMRVMSFEDVPGWTVEPLRDAAGAIIGARWTGTLPVERFVEFGVIGVNPKDKAELVWSADQTYADGTAVSWAGSADSKTPAPRVSLKPAQP